MSCRLGRGWATKNNADAYERIVREEVMPGIEARRIPGFRSIDLVRRERAQDVEFMTLMWFDALDSLRGFMGDDYEAAHVPARAQAGVAAFDRRSAHYGGLHRREQPLESSATRVRPFCLGGLAAHQTTAHRRPRYESVPKPHFRT